MNTRKLASSSKYFFFMHAITFVLKFYNFRMEVRVKMCGNNTVNGTLGMEGGFENELPGSEFN